MFNAPWTALSSPANVHLLAAWLAGCFIFIFFAVSAVFLEEMDHLVLGDLQTLSKNNALHWSMGCSPLQTQFSSTKYSRSRDGCDFVRLDTHNLYKITASSGTLKHRLPEARREYLFYTHLGYVVHPVMATVETTIILVLFRFHAAITLIFVSLCVPWLARFQDLGDIGCHVSALQMSPQGL